MKRWLLIAVDCSIAMLLVLVMWIVNYRIPQKGMKAVAMRPSATEQNIEVDLDNIMGQQTRVILDTQDWHQKFQDKFTDTIILTETSYTSPDVSIQISYHNYDSAKLDETHGGQHKQYGTKIAYVLADVYIGDITCLQTAFAQDMYGIGYEEKLSSMSSRLGSVLAINGDSYSNDRHKDNGTIIRNGTVYRAEYTNMETCVLNWDGTMKIYQPGETDIHQLIETGAYQSWIFGPSLLDDM